MRQVKAPPAKPGRPRLGNWYTPHEPSYRYESTGELVLKAWIHPGSKVKWADGKRQRLEARLSEFTIGLVAMAETDIKRRALQVEWERRARDAEATRRREQQLRQLEEHREQTLDTLAARWGQATRLRAFVAAARIAADDGRDRPLDGQLDRWLRWAERYVDQLDPLNRLDRLPPPYQRNSPYDREAIDEWPPT